MVVYYCRRQKPYKCRLFLNEHLVYTFLLETIFTRDQFVLNVFLLPFGLTSFETTDAFQDITVNSHVRDNLISYIINRNHSIILLQYVVYSYIRIQMFTERFEVNEKRVHISYKIYRYFYNIYIVSTSINLYRKECIKLFAF